MTRNIVYELQVGGTFIWIILQ